MNLIKQLIGALAFFSHLYCTLLNHSSSPMISWRLFGQSHSRLLSVRSLGTTAASRKNVASKVKDDNDNDGKKERFIVPMFPYPSG